MEITKYEKARIVGARALQIAMGAPILTKIGNEMDAIMIAKKELEADVLPISVRRITPKKIVIKKKEEEKTEEPAEVTEEAKKEEKSETGEENKDTKA